MTVEAMGTMGIGTLAILVGVFFAFLIIMHLMTLRSLRREADHQAQTEFKSHVRALMNKLDQMKTSSPQGSRSRAVKKNASKIVPASRTKRAAFPTRSAWRK